MSDSVRPHRRQPTRLPSPWDSPGKNIGVGCQFLLQCMKVKSESEVTQSCPALCDPMDCSLPSSSVHGIFQARVLEWGAIAFSVWGDYKPLIDWCVHCWGLWLEYTDTYNYNKKMVLLFLDLGTNWWEECIIISFKFYSVCRCQCPPAKDPAMTTSVHTGLISRWIMGDCIPWGTWKRGVRKRVL